jgi:hypothetical protein
VGVPPAVRLMSTSTTESLAKCTGTLLSEMGGEPGAGRLGGVGGDDIEINW